MENNTNQWRSRFQEVIKVCQSELKRTTDIGKKMLTASKTNSSLHQAYEELGHLVAQEIERKNLDWDHPRVSELMATIKTCEKDLETIETEVQEIKKTNSESSQNDH